MSDKPRTYSDSAVTLIIRGDNWPSVRGQIDDMNSLADELRKALEMADKLTQSCERKDVEIARLKADLADEVGRP